MLLVFAFTVPLVLEAAREKFVISRGYGASNAWNRSLWIVNSSYVFTVICGALAYTLALISGSRLSRQSALPTPLLALGAGLLTGPIGLVFLSQPLSVWARPSVYDPQFGSTVSQAATGFLSTILLMPAALGAFIAAAVSSLRYRDAAGRT